jgi:hypothetical protein
VEEADMTAMTAQDRVGTRTERELRARIAELESGGNGNGTERVKREPVWVEQKNAKGQTELVDKNLHPNELICPECGETRWVANGDLHQVTHCKPCTKRARKAKRNARARERRAELKAVREEYVAEAEAVLN